MPTLDELKQENIAEEKGEAPAVVEAPKDAPEIEEVTEDVEETTDTEESEIDPEMFKPEEDADKPKFTDGDAAAIRRKYKGKLSEKDEELERVKAELEDIKKKVSAPAQALTTTAKPVREQYATDDQYLEALTDYKINAVTSQSEQLRQQQESQRRREEFAGKTKAHVDQHYTRVAELAKKSNISDDVAKGADLKVRQAVDAVYKGAGDTIVDTLIANLGAGSEKVMLHLGLKTSKLNELLDAFREDPSGLKASAYLGKLSAQLNQPMRRDSSAPAPIDKIQGDRAGSGESGDKLKKRYDELHRKGSGGDAFKVKQQAKALGVDTKSW